MKPPWFKDGVMTFTFIVMFLLRLDRAGDEDGDREQVTLQN